MTPTDLLILADRVEGLPGPCRETDAVIHHAIKNGVATGYAQDAPAYTASVDDAMTLVPDDFQIGVIWDRDERQSNAAVGVNALAGFPLSTGVAKSLDRTVAMALALASASLRTIAANQENPDA